MRGIGNAEAIHKKEMLLYLDCHAFARNDDAFFDNNEAHSVCRRQAHCVQLQKEAIRKTRKGYLPLVIRNVNEFCNDEFIKN